MHLNKILDAAEAYTKAKRDVEALPKDPCDDWDCGIASQLDEDARESCRRRVEETRAALEAALDDYIDAHISAVAEKRDST